MKTNSAARRAWNLRLAIAVLTLAALASYDFWAGGYCYRNRGSASLQQHVPPSVWAANATRSGIFPPEIFR